MGLFNGAIKRDSVSLLKHPFLSYVQVFSCEILSVCSLKYTYSCFSSHFCFVVNIVLLIFMLSVVFLVTVISLSLFFFYVVFESPYWWIHTIFNVGESSSSFLCQYLLIYFLKFYCQTCLLFCFDLFIPKYHSILSFFSIFTLVVAIILPVLV